MATSAEMTGKVREDRICTEGPSWIYGLCDSGMVRAPDATVLVIRILTSMWILVLV